MKSAKRLLIILGAFLFNVALLVGINVVLDAVNGSTVEIQWEAWLIVAAIVVGTQTIFILPLVRLPTTTHYGKSLKMSMVVASLVASIFTFTLVVFVYSLVTTIFLDFPKHDSISLGFFGIFLGCSWVVWSVFLLVFTQRRSHDARPLVRLTAFLFAGSLIEFLLSIPLVIMVNRRSNCYCETGSFFALIASFTASIWLFGPFMVILLFWRKRPWTKDHCYKCGYPRKVVNADVCSECGSIFD
jgi:hypothetical protein